MKSIRTRRLWCIARAAGEARERWRFCGRTAIRTWPICAAGFWRGVRRWIRACLSIRVGGAEAPLCGPSKHESDASIVRGELTLSLPAKAIPGRRPNSLRVRGVVRSIRAAGLSRRLVIARVFPLPKVEPMRPFYGPFGLFEMRKHRSLGSAWGSCRCPFQYSQRAEYSRL